MCRIWNTAIVILLPLPFLEVAAGPSLLGQIQGAHWLSQGKSRCECFCLMCFYMGQCPSKITLRGQVFKYLIFCELQRTSIKWSLRINHTFQCKFSFACP